MKVFPMAPFSQVMHQLLRTYTRTRSLLQVIGCTLIAFFCVGRSRDRSRSECGGVFPAIRCSLFVAAWREVAAETPRPERQRWLCGGQCLHVFIAAARAFIVPERIYLCR